MTPIEDLYTQDELLMLQNCALCPRKCHKNRINGDLGYCKVDAKIAIANICVHKGEEPAIDMGYGVCNVFFQSCNMSCCYCQNFVISRRGFSPNTHYQNVDELVEQIKQQIVVSTNQNKLILRPLGFVSPSHQIPQMKLLIRELHKQGLRPPIIYNTNSYDNVETLKLFSDDVSVYLADMKYAFSSLSRQLSDAKDYPKRALEAIKEMYRQKGSSILTDSNDIISSGLIIRLLCLPQKIANSLRVLDMLAENELLNVQLSLMSQFFAPFTLEDSSLNQVITKEEYDQIVEYAISLGFSKIYTQDLCSQNELRPDFNAESPF